ncbi:MAG: peroxiredoxin [Candidatus Fluviicola riflensis]|nr:MAG: peroxiredoxin [Candidatus Fluviicola riflensis]OGS79252.1 MAG: peroxiredoxin [Candidatus Fluviicola riflensis]OGS86684.1 MAG: peroxiredoxin [Fluviicola sp. RIFCSPHIGHO2_01_FULL_43_53]OGS88842.1 MAG: peroxiredoxin [Fluviicola sp. RIFCSPHIGHO2_12_FULL_43_24]
MEKQHTYHTAIRWTGNKGHGTTGYRNYERDYTISAEGKPDISGSSDPAFRGDKAKYNPEDLLLASIASCHMLGYLHLCSEAGVIVVDYSDRATGLMEETPDGGGRFLFVTLFPAVTVTESSMVEKANELHHEANKLCFIANSLNFKVDHQPTCVVKQ